ncbi:hypothetical protein D3C87_2200260 [compost metagenome]
MKQLPRLQDMSADGNGYVYASGSDIGYKVSKGEICVRSPNKRVDCVRVESDGETLRMVDGRGNKELLR